MDYHTPAHGAMERKEAMQAKVARTPNHGSVIIACMRGTEEPLTYAKSARWNGGTRAREPEQMLSAAQSLTHGGGDTKQVWLREVPQKESKVAKIKARRTDQPIQRSSDPTVGMQVMKWPVLTMTATAPCAPKKEVTELKAQQRGD